MAFEGYAKAPSAAGMAGSTGTCTDGRIGDSLSGIQGGGPQAGRAETPVRRSRNPTGRQAPRRLRYRIDWLTSLVLGSPNVGRLSHRP